MLYRGPRAQTPEIELRPLVIVGIPQIVIDLFRAAEAEEPLQSADRKFTAASVQYVYFFGATGPTTSAGPQPRSCSAYHRCLPSPFPGFCGCFGPSLSTFTTKLDVIFRKRSSAIHTRKARSWLSTFAAENRVLFENISAFARLSIRIFGILIIVFDVVDRLIKDVSDIIFVRLRGKRGSEGR